jgi:hypothetical protein
MASHEQVRWSRRSAALLLLAWPSCAFGQSEIIENYAEFRRYLQTATRVVLQLTTGIREARTTGTLTSDEQHALAAIASSLETVLGGQTRDTEFLMEFIIAARQEGATPESLATRWREARYRLSRTSDALADVVRTARATPAFRTALPQDAERQFFDLTNSRAGLMARLIALPMPSTEAELAGLEQTVEAWRELISQSQRLLDDIRGQSST